jgi:hypothetical protein
MAKNYKRKQKVTTKKRPLSRFAAPIIILILLVAAGGSIAIVHYRGKTTPPAKNPVAPTNTIYHGPPTVQDKAAVNATKQQIVASGQTSNNDTSTSTNSGSSISTTTTTSSDISVFIVGVTNATASQPLDVRDQVSGTTSGTCTISFAKSGQTSFSEQVSITFQATSASCNDSIPASDFPANGAWTMTIVAQNGSQVSPTVGQSVEVSQ